MRKVFSCLCDLFITCYTER